MIFTKLPPYQILKNVYSKVVNTSGDRHSEETKDEFIRKLLVEDNYFLHIRHAAREESIDIQGFDWAEINLKQEKIGEIAKFTCLNEEGVAQAQLMRFIFESINRPLEIIASPSCRAVENAQIAFGKVDKIELAHLHLSAVPDAIKDDFKLKQREFFLNHDFSMPGLTVIIGHNGMAYDGVDWINRQDGQIARKQGGVSILSFDPDTEQVVVHYTFERLTDFAMSLPTFVE